MPDISWALHRLVHPGRPDENWGFTAYRVAYGPGTDEKWAKFQTSLEAAVRNEVDRADCRSDKNDPHHMRGNYDLPPAQQRDRMYSLFRLDTRADEEALDGASMDAIRARYVDGETHREQMHREETERLREAFPEECRGNEEQLHGGPQDLKVGEAERPVYVHADSEDRDHKTGGETLDDGGWVNVVHGGDERRPAQHVFMYVDDEVLDNIETGGAPRDGPWVKVVAIDYDPERHKGNGRIPPHPYFGFIKVALDSLLELWEYLENDDLENTVGWCGPNVAPFEVWSWRMR